MSSEVKLTLEFDSAPTVAQLIDALAKLDPTCVVTVRVRMGGTLRSVAGKPQG